MPTKTSNIFLNSVLFTLGLIVLTVATYYAFTYIDFSSGYFTVVKAALLIASLFYFILLSRHSDLLKQIAERINKRANLKSAGLVILGLILMMLHLVVTHVGGEEINTYLLADNNKQITGVIKRCYKSGGTQHCIYGYTVDGAYYERLHNNLPKDYKYKEKDTVTVLYYPPNPVISRLK